MNVSVPVPVPVPGTSGVLFTLAPTSVVFNGAEGYYPTAQLSQPGSGTGTGTDTFTGTRFRDTH